MLTEQFRFQRLQLVPQLDFAEALGFLDFPRKVFLTPPWPETYVNDKDRRHPLSEAVEEYERLLDVNPSAGYEIVILPKTGVRARANFVLDFPRNRRHRQASK